MRLIPSNQFSATCKSAWSTEGATCHCSDPPLCPAPLTQTEKLEAPFSSGLPSDTIVLSFCCWLDGVECMDSVMRMTDKLRNQLFISSNLHRTKTTPRFFQIGHSLTKWLPVKFLIIRTRNLPRAIFMNVTGLFRKLHRMFT